MHRELKEQIREVRSRSSDKKLDFTSLLHLIDQHYDKMEATLSESLAQSLTATTPIEIIFDAVTDALLSVTNTGHILNCNKVCSRYFGLEKDNIVGASLYDFIPSSKGRLFGEFLSPYMSNLDDTNVDFAGGEVQAQRANGDSFTAEINCSRLDSGSKIYVVNLGMFRDEKTRNVT
jgi:PAS domain S-box-containing protein